MGPIRNENEKGTSVNSASFQESTEDSQQQWLKAKQRKLVPLKQPKRENKLLRQGGNFAPIVASDFLSFF